MSRPEFRDEPRPGSKGTPDPHVAGVRWVCFRGRVWYTRQHGGMYWKWVPPSVEDVDTYELSSTDYGYVHSTPERELLWITLMLAGE